MPASHKEPLHLEQSKALAGVLALLAVEREERIQTNGDKAARKTEVVLSEVGLTAPEIARLMDKPESGVAKAITRARSKSKSTKRRGTKRGK